MELGLAKKMHTPIYSIMTLLLYSYNMGKSPILFYFFSNKKIQLIQLKYDIFFFLTLFDLYIEKKIATTFNTNSIIYDLEIIKNAEFHF